MRRISNNIIAAFMVFLMLSSAISTTLISFYAKERLSTTGKAVSQTGTVGIIINGTGGGGGGSSGGGGGATGGSGGILVDRTHILDFKIRNDYVFNAGKDNIIIVVSNMSNYTFVVESANPLTTKLLISSKTFSVSKDIIAKLDLDGDGIDDFHIYYNNFEYKFIHVYSYKQLPIIETPKPPQVEIIPKLYIAKNIGILPFVILLFIIFFTVSTFILVQKHRKFNVTVIGAMFIAIIGIVISLLIPKIKESPPTISLEKITENSPPPFIINPNYFTIVLLILLIIIAIVLFIQFIQIYKNR